MAQILDIPIRMRCTKIPVRWEIREVRGDARHAPRQYAFPTLIDDGSLDAFNVAENDAWSRRDDFFAIRENDNDALGEFLEKVGKWSGQGVSYHWSLEVLLHYKREGLMPVDVPGLWRFRDSLKSALANPKSFKEIYAPPIPQTKTGLQLFKQHNLEFPLVFELTDVACGLLTIDDAYRALLLTAFLDVARGIRFKVCKREDCKKPFPIRSEHERKFCSQYCGHFVSQKRKRENQRKLRRAEKEKGKLRRRQKK